MNRVRVKVPNGDVYNGEVRYESHDLITMTNVRVDRANGNTDYLTQGSNVVSIPITSRHEVTRVDVQDTAEGRVRAAAEGRWTSDGRAQPYVTDLREVLDELDRLRGET